VLIPSHEYHRCPGETLPSIISLRSLVFPGLSRSSTCYGIIHISIGIALFPWEFHSIWIPYSRRALKHAPWTLLGTSSLAASTRSGARTILELLILAFSSLASTIFRNALFLTKTGIPVTAYLRAVQTLSSHSMVFKSSQSSEMTSSENQHVGSSAIMSPVLS